MAERWDLVRSPRTGCYKVGLMFVGVNGPTMMSWRALTAKRKDAAMRQVPAALAALLDQNAEQLEQEAVRLLELANKLRTAALSK